MKLRNIKSLLVTFCFMMTATLNSVAISNIYTIQPDIQQMTKLIDHTVAKGETVYSIAKLYNISIIEIYALNPKAESGINIGDVLKIPYSLSDQVTLIKDNNVDYIVKSKETLYAIAKNNGTTVEDIIKVNPELKSKPLAEGQVLKIPVSLNISRTSMAEAQKAITNQATLPTSAVNNKFLTHQVGSKETIYGITKQYNITPEALIDFNPSLKEGLKVGETIVIPILESSATKSTLKNTEKSSIGLILPFVNKSEGQSARFVEYYEGFLLALKKMKSKGFSANVYVFDIGTESGTEKLKSLLDTYEMKYLDLIIGGVSKEQVDIISAFAKQQGIKYAIPFPTKSSDAENNAQVFQINAPYSILYRNVANVFADLFPFSNVIYISEKDKEGDRAEFVTVLNQLLPKASINTKTVLIDQSFVANLTSALDPVRKNIIIPTSASSRMLQSVLAALRVAVKDQSATNVTLFGHTDWQTYSQLQKEYAKYDTYIYTPFYLNGEDGRVKEFIAEYKKWYNNKSLINTYPKYGVLGYDTGIAFMTALMNYGKNFYQNPRSTDVPTLQTPFIFKQQNSNSAYVNNGFYLIHYNVDNSINKIEYGR